MVLREIFGFPGKVIEAATGSRDVVPTMKTRIDDYKNVLRFLEQGSSGTFDHEVKRLRALLKELEDLKKEHVGGKNRFEGVCKACSRADLHPDILRKLRTIDEEVIRQFTAMAAKSAIGGQQPMEGSPFYPITAGDPTSFKPLLADNSELATTPSEGEPARIFRFRNWREHFDEDEKKFWVRIGKPETVTYDDPYPQPNSKSGPTDLAILRSSPTTTVASATGTL